MLGQLGIVVGVSLDMLFEFQGHSVSFFRSGLTSENPFFSSFYQTTTTTTHRCHHI
jgi:hypothetical protein